MTRLGKRYLGDAVYAEFDGFMLKLTTEDGIVNPTNTIYLEPEVYGALVAYVADLTAERLAQRMARERGETP